MVVLEEEEEAKKNMGVLGELGRKLSVLDVNAASKRVLMRVDFNVPLGRDGSVADNQRIVAALPTINHLLEQGVHQLVLLSHLGRPDGERIPSLSLHPVAKELERLLGRRVIFVTDCVGEEAERLTKGEDNAQRQDRSSAKVILMENLRFHVEEEGAVTRKDGTKVSATQEQISAFRRSLSSLGEIFVNDAFGALHRPHSSIVGIEMDLRVAGLLVKKELDYFGKVLDSPNPIDLAILGGAKVADKIQLIKNMLPRVKKLAIGGGMSFTFLKVLFHMPIGRSLFDSKGASLVPEIMAEAERRGVELILPIDFITGTAPTEDSPVGSATREEGGEGIPDQMMGLDIGPRSIQLLSTHIAKAKTILWNGPVGVFEVSHFEGGTRRLVQALVSATSAGALTIVGGGDSGAAVARYGAENKLSHVSTGGGASLELLEGRILPGIVALTDRP